MQRKVGLERTKAIKKRYNQIVSFSSFFALQQAGIGKLESLEGDWKGYYSLTISANYRLIIKPESLDLSAESLKKCDTIIIEGVLDYHGRGRNDSWLFP